MKEDKVTHAEQVNKNLENRHKKGGYKITLVSEIS